MLKFFVLVSILLNLSFCRSLQTEEDICKAEAKRWSACDEKYPGVYIPFHDDRLECYGDLKCKGQRKWIKFQFDMLEFIGKRARVFRWNKCVRESGQDEEIKNCQTQKSPYDMDDVPRKPAVHCVKEVVEKTNCTAEEKSYYVGDFAMHKDLDKQIRFATIDEEYLNNFDLKFDPKNYGF